jgi:thymidylate kinase
MVTVIECIGLWGSGKTTTSQALASGLKASGIEVATYEDCQTYASQKSRLLRWYRYLKHPQLLRFFCFSIRYCYKHGLKKHTNNHRMKLWFEPIKVAVDVDFYADNHVNTEYIICDEALWNNLAIYANNYNLSEIELQNCYKKIKYSLPQFFILFLVTPHEAALRTGQRGFYGNDKKSFRERLSLANDLNKYIQVAHQNVLTDGSSVVLVQEDEGTDKIVTNVISKLFNK